MCLSHEALSDPEESLWSAPARGLSAPSRSELAYERPLAGSRSSRMVEVKQAEAVLALAKLYEPCTLTRCPSMALLIIRYELNVKFEIL